MDFDASSTTSLLSDGVLDRDHSASSSNARLGIGNIQHQNLNGSPYDGSDWSAASGSQDRRQRLPEFKPRSFTNESLRPSLDQDFYDSIDSVPNNNQSALHCFTACVSRVSKSNMSSHRIPQWAWVVLVHVLGINKLGSKRRPCLSLFLNVLTILLACTFTVTGTIHTVYDINSKFSDTTLLMGTVNLVIGFGWICLGIYSNKVASNLFSNRNFVESVRIHSRTFFKISAAGLLMVLGCGAVVINGYLAYSEFGPRHCQKIILNPIVCHVMYSSHVAFSVISLIWNLFVGCVLLSVCRTHTIGIRRFIKLLEDDARIYDIICKGNYIKMQRQISKNLDYVSSQHRSASESEWFIWDDNIQTNHSNGYTDSYNVDHCLQRPHSTNLSQGQSGGALPVDNRQFEDSQNSRQEDISILTNEELLVSYWKISNRMRITSKCLQRWLASWIVFVLLWCVDYIFYWISHSAEPLPIAQCVIPLLLLMIVCTAFAEANGEGQHMIRCICPTEERLHILRFLNQQPLQMQVFNFSITYNALVGVIAAFAIAFASRIILDEVYK